MDKLVDHIQSAIHTHAPHRRGPPLAPAEQPQTLTVAELSTVPLHFNTLTRMVVGVCVCVVVVLCVFFVFVFEEPEG